MKEFVRIEVEFEHPQGCTLEDCCKLVMNQMRAKPQWDEPGGTGLLNYVCYDHHLRIVGAAVKDA